MLRVTTAASRCPHLTPPQGMDVCPQNVALLCLPASVCVQGAGARASCSLAAGRLWSLATHPTVSPCVVGSQLRNISRAWHRAQRPCACRAVALPACKAVVRVVFHCRHGVLLWGRCLMCVVRGTCVVRGVLCCVGGPCCCRQHPARVRGWLSSPPTTWHKLLPRVSSLCAPALERAHTHAHRCSLWLPCTPAALLLSLRGLL
jgi:hypothetical protein